MSSMHVFRNQVCAQADQYRHIPGHCGIPGNELADVLSKQGARSRAFTCGLLVSGDTLSRWFSADSRLLSWAALAVRSLRGDPTVPPVNTDLSALHSHHAGLAPSQLLAPFLPPGTLEKEQHEVNQSAHAPYQTRVIPYRLGLNLATFNVLLLKTASIKLPEKSVLRISQHERLSLLAEQLRSRSIQVAFLQETRADSGLSRVGEYIRLASGAVRGQFGTEVWFKANHVLFRGRARDEDVDTFTKNRLTVLESDERRLLVRFSGRQISILFAGLHAPHRAHERCIIEAWSGDTRRMLDKHIRQSCLVLGGDMNAALGSVASAQVGEVAPEDQDVAGDHLHSIARSFGLYFPATMPACHNGPSYTYTQKKGGASCWFDFLAIPLDWSHGRVVSSCDPAIHAAHPAPDHVAARLDVDTWFASRPVAARVSQRQIRVTDITNPAQRDNIVHILSTAPAVPWEVSAHAHAAILTAHVQQGLQHLASTSAARPHHPYLQEATWQMHKEASTVRRELHRLTSIMTRNDLAVGFRAWATSRPLREIMRGGSKWLAAAQRTRHELHSRLTELCKQLKKACRRDPLSYQSHPQRRLIERTTKSWHTAARSLSSLTLYPKSAT